MTVYVLVHLSDQGYDTPEGVFRTYGLADEVRTTLIDAVDYEILGYTVEEE